jgi:hypothetical protein
MSNKSPKMLMNMMQGTAALLVLDDDGDLWVHQTGGVLCNHPTAKGSLAPLPKDVREEVNARFWGKCPTDFEIREFMLDFDLPWEPNGFAEEAWVPLSNTLDDTKAILVWNNSD